MKETEQKKSYFYVDESGDTVFFDRRGNDLVSSGHASRVFLVGYYETSDPNDIHKRLSKVREENMKSALNNAKSIFCQKWGRENKSAIRIFIQEPSQITPLQVIDYLLWSVNRVYEKGDMRYFNFVKDKIVLVQDIFDTAKYPNNYYNAKNPLDINKISPI